LAAPAFNISYYKPLNYFLLPSWFKFAGVEIVIKITSLNHSSQGSIKNMTIRRIILSFIIALISLNLTLHQASAQKKRASRKGNKEFHSAGKKEGDPRIAESNFIEAEKYFMIEDYAKSLSLFQKVLEVQPENSAAQFKIAQIFTETDEIDKALTYAQQASVNNPGNKFYYILLAEIYTKKSDYGHATETYEKLINSIPGTDEYLFELAAIYMYEKDYDNALKSYNRIEEKFGVNEQVCLQRKDIYKKQGKLDKVIEEGNKLIETFNDEPEYVILQANTLMANDRTRDAIDLLEKWLPHYSTNGTMLLTLSEAYRAAGDIEKSKEYVNRAFDYPDLNLQSKLQYIVGQLEKPIDSVSRKFLYELVNKTILSNPNQAESYAIYGDVLIRLDSSEAAKKMYLKSLQINENNFQAWQNIINIEISGNDWDNVIVHSEKAIEVFPNQAIFYFFLGTGYLIKKDYTRAVSNLEMGKKLASSNLQLTSWFNAQLGDGYFYLKNYLKSDEAYEAALLYDSDNYPVLNNYSYFLSLRKENLDKAAKMSLKLIQENPDNATYLDTHAWVLYNQGKLEEAKTIIERAVRQKENLSGTIVEHYGDILFRLGKEKEAMEQWQKAREMGETSDLINKKISDGKLYE
jgi:tetratricopeptide (TPR) repeat protein